MIWFLTTCTPVYVPYEVLTQGCISAFQVPGQEQAHGHPDCGHDVTVNGYEILALFVAYQAWQYIDPAVPTLCTKLYANTVHLIQTHEHEKHPKIKKTLNVNSAA